MLGDYSIMLQQACEQNPYSHGKQPVALLAMSVECMFPTALLVPQSAAPGNWTAGVNTTLKWPSTFKQVQKATGVTYGIGNATWSIG